MFILLMSLFTFIAMMLNFNIYNDANLMNLVITIVYLAIWFIVYYNSLRQKIINYIISTTIFWIIVLAFGILLLLVSLNIINISEGFEFLYIVIYFFMFPMYGIDFLFSGSSAFYVAIMVISLLFIIPAAIYFIKTRQNAKIE